MNASRSDAKAEHADRPRSPGHPGGRPISALVTVQVLFGLHYLAAKIVVQTIPPPAWALLRASLAGLLLVILLYAGGMSLPKGRGTFLRFLGLSLIGVSINQYLFIEGLHRSSVGHSALIITSMPVTVVLIAMILGRERPTLQRLLGIGVTLAGIVILIGPDRIDWHADSFRGDLMTAMNALSYSLFLVLGKPVFQRERTLPASTLLFLLGGAWLVPLGARDVLALDITAIDARTWMLGLFIVLGPTIGAYGLNTYALRRVDSSMVAFFIYLQPLVGAGLSILLGFERLTLRLLLAAAIVFLGVFIALRAPAVPAAPPLISEP